MKLRSGYVSNSSSASFVIYCDNEKHLKYIQNVLNEYLEVMSKIHSSIDGSFSLNDDKKSIELFTEDGEYIYQEAVRNIQKFIKLFGMSDEDGEKIKFTVEEIYMG